MTNDDATGSGGNNSKSTQFVKGKSGNPRGRPPEYMRWRNKKHKNIVDDFVDELERSVTIKESGKVLKITQERAIVKSLVSQAIKGNRRAVTMLLKLTKEYGWDRDDGTAVVKYRVTKEKEIRMAQYIEHVKKSLGVDDDEEPDWRPWWLPPDYFSSKREPPAWRRLSSNIADDLLAELRQPISITEGGRKRTMTKQLALVKSLVYQARVGNVQALSLILALAKRYEWDKDDDFVRRTRLDARFYEFLDEASDEA